MSKTMRFNSSWMVLTLLFAMALVGYYVYLYNEIMCEGSASSPSPSRATSMRTGAFVGSVVLTPDSRNEILDAFVEHNHVLVINTFGVKVIKKNLGYRLCIVAKSEQEIRFKLNGAKCDYGVCVPPENRSIAVFHCDWNPFKGETTPTVEVGENRYSVRLEQPQVKDN